MGEEKVRQLYLEENNIDLECGRTEALNKVRSLNGCMQGRKGVNCIRSGLAGARACPLSHVFRCILTKILYYIMKTGFSWNFIILGPSEALEEPWSRSDLARVDVGRSFEDSWTDARNPLDPNTGSSFLG
jgi:hypothetical protein